MKKFIKFFQKKRIYKIFIFIFIILLNSFVILKYKIKNYNKENSLKKGREYLNICLKGLLINKSKFNFSYKKPIISVIIPVYNCRNTIKFSLRSVQNQKMRNIEIILVNDFSKDNSELVIQEMQKEDLRIKMINNKKNMGTLYTRNIGVLFSKGKYIFALDNDDMFLNNDIFTTLYKEAKNTDIDIIGFKVIRGNNYFSRVLDMYDDIFHMHKNNLIVSQPKLKFFSILNRECHIWGKCIKSDIYKMSINALGIKRYSINISFGEDDVIVFILFNFANSFKFISKYGIYHLIHKNSASFTLSKSYILFCRIYFLDILFDFTKNNEKKYVVFKTIDLLKFKNFSSLLTNKNIKYLKLVLKKIIDCKHISQTSKMKIKNLYKKFNLIN